MKFVYTFCLSTLILMLSACNSVTEKGGIDGVPTTMIEDPEIHKNEVINSNGRIEGLERLISFYDNVQSKLPSNLRIVHYTTDGNSTVTNLSYDGEYLEVENDTTMDKSKGITKSTCGNLIEEVNYINTTYKAIGCTNSHDGLIEILHIDYNPNQEELFELQYHFDYKHNAR